MSPGRARIASRWAEHVLAAMLLPNLVWRAGRVAEQVRLAAMLCVSRLLPRGLVSPTQLHGMIESGLPGNHLPLAV